MIVPAGPAQVPTPLPHPFTGIVSGGTVAHRARSAGSRPPSSARRADNTPAHLPTPPGVTFQKPPANKATIQMGSATVKIGGKAAARNGDTALTLQRPGRRAGRAR